MSLHGVATKVEKNLVENVVPVLIELKRLNQMGLSTL